MEIWAFHEDPYWPGHDERLVGRVERCVCLVGVDVRKLCLGLFTVRLVNGHVERRFIGVDAGPGDYATNRYGDRWHPREMVRYVVDVMRMGLPINWYRTDFVPVWRVDADMLRQVEVWREEHGATTDKELESILTPGWEKVRWL